MLDNSNAEEYLALTEHFILEHGIRRQLESFKCKLLSILCVMKCYNYLAGFDRVFPMTRLRIFSPHELRLVLCGEQAPSWTREELLKFTVPKYGYTTDR